MVTLAPIGRLLGAALLMAVGGATLPAYASCGQLLPSADGGAAHPKRDITTADLIGLRDIGYPDAAQTGAQTPFGVSPNGKMVAFVVNQADVATNGYCRALVILPTSGGLPRIVDRGGDFLQLRTSVRGLLAATGVTQVATPSWSPDGRYIAYIKRTDGRTRIWLVDVATASARAVTTPPVDVEDLAWANGGRTIVFRARPREAIVERDVDREGRSGWLYDDRMTPNAGARPRLREADVPADVLAVDVATDVVRSATFDEHTAMAEAADGMTATAVALAGDRVTIAAGPSLLAPRYIVADHARAALPCSDASCTGSFVGIWRAGPGSVVFLRRDGWRDERSSLYRWCLGASRAKLILSTSDALTGCAAAAGALICGRENAVTPRRIVRIDLATGRVTTLFDPNPEFASIALGTVRRLKWRNDRGMEAWGDFVLPPHYRPGTKLPMVVVQYHSRGFLRGGTDDEYPIFLLAEHGFAVLSFERPDAIASLIPDIKTATEANAANFKGWADRRSIQSSIEEGVRQAVATGTVDASRLGITGLSDGATSVRFALINSTLFKAAALSSCCVEPVTAMTLNGPRFSDSNRAMGYPVVGDADAAFWAPMSLAMSAARIDVPLLMQLADDEYLIGLEAFEALRERHKPVEMFVYPDEHHGKWQPVHRLAIYERNLDWFDFWLRSQRDPDPAKDDQYRRWEAMRARLTRG